MGCFSFACAGIRTLTLFQSARSAPAGAEGSNPSPAAIKEAAFVYHDKGGYFVLFEQKAAFSRIIGLPSGFAVVRRPDFTVFRVKMLVYFCLYFTEIKYAQKSQGGRI